MTALRFEGQLAAHAETRMHADGTAIVIVQLDQQKSAPVLVIRSFGKGPAASYAAGNAANSMRKGMTVTVHGQSVRAAMWRGQPVVRIEGVDHIEHPALIARHEPAAQAA